MAIPTVDEVWADFAADGHTPKEPFKQDIRRLLNFIQTAAVSNTGARRYLNKAAMDADTSQANGQLGLITNDPVAANNYPTLWYFNSAGPAWVMGVDRITPMANAVAQSTAADDGIYRATGAPRPLAFADPTSYAGTNFPISNVSTRFSIDAQASGYTITGLPGLGAAIIPVGIKLPYDLLPGDSFTFEGLFTAGTLTTAAGMFFGTDSATTGDISAAALLTVYRNGSLLLATSNGLSGDASRHLTPAFGPAGSPFSPGLPAQFMVDVLSDRSYRYRVFQLGIQVAGDVVVSNEGPSGAVIIGFNIANGWTARITRVTRRTAPGAVLFVHSGVGSSGDGTIGAPLKTLNDIPKAIFDLGLAGQAITINFLTDNIYGYLELKDSLSPRWTLNGLPQGNTTLNGFNFAEVPVWTLVPGTTKVYRTPNLWGLEARSQPNQVFVAGLAWNPRPWYSMPATTLVTMITSNGGVDMDGIAGGVCATSGGQFYLRLPDVLPSQDPSTYPRPIDPLNPTGPKYSLVLARTFNIVKVVGTPEINVNNVTMRWAAGPLFDGGSGFGRFTNCHFEWSGYNTPGIEEHNGQFVYDGCHWKFSDGDGLGRTPRIDIPFQNGSTLVSRLHQCEISHTGRQEITPGSGTFLGGDGFSVHIVEDGTNRRHEIWMTSCHVHDCYKCGVVVSADYWFMDGCVVERCGTEQVSLFGVPTASALGRTQRAIILNTRIDPQSVGNSGVRCLYTDGMALCEMQLDNCWIGTPTGPGAAELWLTVAPLSGGVRDITKNRIVYRNCTTERAPGSVVKTGNGTQGTLVPYTAYPLA